MILLELILFIVAGTICFIVSQILNWIDERYPPAPRTPRKRRGKIKADLDMVLHSYQQGLLNEEQYLDQTDELIDELAELMHKK
ncbi:hypothetical protein [Dyadobacter sp. Leaf189]|uniref:hypothetical protein n=1 Tax=Dyadobacter sp. Leaf189 TaxID=1736295 RepID=UPI0006F86484|nr:hypothetical protein [Dyadobacter sp. Leaf189]KQS30755.1 hypothetical protein ASG33_10240 [Dyadobacter sp. Leaf189]